MLSMFKMRSHRYFQLLGVLLTGGLFTFYQYQLVFYQSQVDRSQATAFEVVDQTIYYTTKILACEIVGQEKLVEDCKKGIYQNERLNMALTSIKESGEKVAELRQTIFKIVFFGSLFLFVGFWAEYVREYRKDTEKKKTSYEEIEAWLSLVASRDDVRILIKRVNNE